MLAEREATDRDAWAVTTAESCKSANWAHDARSWRHIVTEYAAQALSAVYVVRSGCLAIRRGVAPQSATFGPRFHYTRVRRASMNTNRFALLVACVSVSLLAHAHGHRWHHRHRWHSDRGWTLPRRDALPDLQLTPGAIGGAVTQMNIHRTICRYGYTRTVRPPEAYTERLKRRQIREYGYTDHWLSDYEEDHLLWRVDALLRTGTTLGNSRYDARRNTRSVAQRTGFPVRDDGSLV